MIAYETIRACGVYQLTNVPGSIEVSGKYRITGPGGVIDDGVLWYRLDERGERVGELQRERVESFAPRVVHYVGKSPRYERSRAFSLAWTEE